MLLRLLVRCLLEPLLRGGAFGLIWLGGFTFLLSWLMLGPGYGYLNLWAIRQVAQVADNLPERTAVTAPVDAKRSRIIREMGGDPILAFQRLPGDSSLGFSGRPTLHRLLSRYRAHLKPPEGASPSPSAGKPRYIPQILIVEVVLEWNEYNEWRVMVDVGYQGRAGEWKRLPWWHKEGIAPTNELVRVERSTMFPVVWSFSTPTTAEAVCAYLKDYFLQTARIVNPAYNEADTIRMSAKEFERGVVHPLMRVLPADYGGVSVLWYVFLFNTANGPLQALMFACFFSGLLLTLLRLVFLMAIPRWQACSRRWTPLPANYGRPPVLSPTRAVSDELARNDAFASAPQLKEAADGTFAANQTGLWVHRQLEAWVVYFGLLGTLLYLSLAIMQLRIHPSTAVMQSILASMSVTMAQAFLTTIVSSTLQRIMETVRELATAQEELAAAGAARWGEGLRVG